MNETVFKGTRKAPRLGGGKRKNRSGRKEARRAVAAAPPGRQVWVPVASEEYWHSYGGYWEHR